MVMSHFAQASVPKLRLMTLGGGKPGGSSEVVCFLISSFCWLLVHQVVDTQVFSILCL